MIRKIRKIAINGISICTCFIIFCSAAGCGKDKSDDLSAIQIEENYGEESDEGYVVKINQEGHPIRDFDEFVNGDWYIDQKRRGAGDISALDEEFSKANDAIHRIINSTDIDVISENEGLNKIIFFYKQIMDTSDSNVRIETTKRYLEPIQSIENLEDLYLLYENPEYDVFNGLLNFCVIADDFGCNTLYFWPQSLMSSIENSNQIILFMSKLGYPEQESQSIIANALIISKMVEEYWDSPVMNEGAHYYDQETLDAASVSVPVLDILEELGMFGCYKEVLAGGDFCGFLNETFQSENISALRDYYLICAIYRLLAVADDKESWVQTGTGYDALVLSIAMDFGADVINEEYKKRYLDDASDELTKALAEEVKDTMIEIISEMDWLTDNGKELAIQKIRAIRECFGGNQDINDLGDVFLSDDVVENYISFLISQNNHYKKQTWKQDDRRELFNENPFEPNARYNRRYAMLSISSPILCNSRCSEGASYEEKIGYLGFLIAHEMAHTYDSSGIVYDSKGHYSPWMTEGEETAYNTKLQEISKFFDGKETVYGCTIDGDLVIDEALADVLAIECCIRMLQKKEKINYDLFFRTLAEWNAYYYTENGIKTAILDTHLPAKERINYIFGQMDKFYEIYEIDKDGPYYIPEDERLSKLLKMP